MDAIDSETTSALDSALYSFIFDVLADRDSRIKDPEMVGITWKIDRKPNVFAFSISLDEFDDIVGRMAHPMRWYAPFQFLRQLVYSGRSSL